MRYQGNLILAATLALCTHPAGYIQHPQCLAAEAQPTPWAQLSAKAKSQFQPITDQHVNDARNTLQKVVRRLDAYLAENGDNGDAWRKYLGWEMLQQQLDPKSELNVVGLEEVNRRFTGGYSGLELRWFRDVVEPLRRYTDLLEARSNTELKAQYEAQLDVIATTALTVEKQPTVADVAKLSEAVGFLRTLGTAPQVVEAVEQRFSQPNFFFQTSALFLRSGIERDLNDELEICECQGKTFVSGKGTTTGKLSLNLIPSPNQGLFETVLDGVTHTQATAVKQPAIVCTVGRTSLWGRKTLQVNSEAVSTADAEATADTDLQVTGIGSTKGGPVGRIVLRVAPKAVAKELPKSRAQANFKAQRMLKSRLDSEAGKTVAEANTNYQNKLRLPLTRFHAFPRLFNWHTTHDNVALTLGHDLRNRLSAPSAPPELSGTPDMALRLHESFINNYTQSILGGRKLRQEDVESMLVNQFGEVPEKMKQDKDEEEKGPWSVTFPNENPVTIHVDDNLLVFTFRGSRYTSGDRSFGAMNVTSRYQLAHDGRTVRATRQGDLEVVPPNFKPGQTLSPRDTVLRNLLRKKFTKLFDEQIVLDAIKLQGAFEKAGALYATQWKADNGWVLVGWQRQPQPATAAVTIAR